MNVTCHKCGASVPPEIAFCPECGAVMSDDAPRKRLNDPSASLEATIRGKAFLPSDFDKMLRATGHAGGARRAEADSTRAEASGAQKNFAPASSESRSRSTLVFVVGLAVVLGLGGLLIYLISVILRG